MAAKKLAAPAPPKSLEAWIWDAACSIRGAKDAPGYKDFIPPIFVKRLGDVYDELDRIACCTYPSRTTDRSGRA
jgi:hypothetical protein